jgi:hypothetical protein
MANFFTINKRDRRVKGKSAPNRGKEGESEGEYKSGWGRGTRTRGEFKPAPVSTPNTIPNHRIDR